MLLTPAESQPVTGVYCADADLGRLGKEGTEGGGRGSWSAARSLSWNTDARVGGGRGRRMVVGAHEHVSYNGERFPPFSFLPEQG